MGRARARVRNVFVQHPGAEQLQCIAQIGVHISAFVARRERTLVMGDRFAATPQCLQRMAEPAVRLGRTRIDAEGSPVAFDCRLKTAEASKNDAQQRPRLGRPMVRLGRTA